jgi:hypothetical protein
MEIGARVAYAAKIGTVTGKAQGSRGKTLVVIALDNGATIKVDAKFVEPAKATFTPPDWTGRTLSSAEVVRNRINGR